MRSLVAYVNGFSHEESGAVLLADNPDRIGFLVVNDSGADLYIHFGHDVSLDRWTDRLKPGERFNALNVPPERLYTGVVTFVFGDATDGHARVTELVRGGC